MFRKLALTAFFVILSASFSRADVTPSDPGPGTVSNAGSTCYITWIGDTSSPTAWKGMSIELMTGSNYDMVHLTTVASNLDGTTSGQYTWTCPQVTPNSAIYFYQFTGPNAPDKQWTTRFTIASSSGQSTPPSNATQPGTGETIPWGNGALVDPSTAVAAPSYLSGGSVSSASSSISATTSTAASSSSSEAVTTATSAGSSSATPTRITTVVAATTTPSTTATTSSNSAAAAHDRSISGLVLGTCVMILMVVF
ncbi:hypothetical protein AX15_000792 [Amanita polypyramis BW_CC]|nr:hypothetical protein AX15_000792 [Amanita polypyramis BW_CC]